MEIVGTREEVPAKKVVREKGSYHPDVLAMIEDIDKSEVKAVPKDGTDEKSNLWEGEFRVFAFKDDKEAQTRATTLRRAGYVAVVRGSEVYGSKPDGEWTTEDEDDAE